jgi:hypothetical protein
MHLVDRFIHETLSYNMYVYTQFNLPTITHWSFGICDTFFRVLALHRLMRRSSTPFFNVQTPSFFLLDLPPAL